MSKIRYLHILVTNRKYLKNKTPASTGACNSNLFIYTDDTRYTEEVLHKKGVI